jgi:hypothetical protein
MVHDQFAVTSISPTFFALNKCYSGAVHLLITTILDIMIVHFIDCKMDKPILLGTFVAGKVA